MSEPLHDRVVAAIGGQYHLEHEIGRGGMSVVFRAHDRRLNRPVAIKVLPPEWSHDPAVRLRFTREAQTSAQLSHPHIVPIYDVGERDGIAWFVMGEITGGTLATLLAHEPRQPVDEVRRLLREIADALSYAHLRGVIHRDIKPDNILLDGNTGRALVTDFGIAQAIESGARLTATGIAVGTPTYMSPEQAVGEREVDGRSDIYSLGVVAYQMLTGRVPFAASNSMALLLKHVNEAPRPISELRRDTPRALRDAIERALSKSPEDRWPSAATFRDAIMSDAPQGASWRADAPDPVRYASPRPEAPRRERAGRDGAVARVDLREASPRRGVTPAAAPAGDVVGRGKGSEIILEPVHLRALTSAERADLRLWHGRVNLLDRIRAARGYLVSTVATTVLGFASLAAINEFPPVLFAPAIPLFMWIKLWRRAKSLRKSGLRLRRVFLMPRARWVLPSDSTAGDKALLKLVSRDVLDSRYGRAVRQAAEERAAILSVTATLSKADRALLPDLEPTVNGLVGRAAHLATALHRLEPSVDRHMAEQLDARIADARQSPVSPEGERRLALLQRQRTSLDDLEQRHASLSRQLDNAVLALGNLRLDMIRVRSSGLQAAFADVSTATQEARALSHDIALVLDAASEAGSL
jgi:serine/threonine-protein kinase